jgi:surface antigen
MWRMSLGTPRSLTAPRAAPVLLIVCATIACATAGSAARAAGSAAPIVYGYPYADRCPGAGFADMVDRWGMYACNCTSYVAWALQANGQRIDWFIPGAMDAWNWPHVARLSGLRIARVPRVGAVAVWPRLAPPFGHVGYVTRVHRDGTMDVSEYNLPSASGFAPFAYDHRVDVPPAGAEFIYVPKANPTVA